MFLTERVLTHNANDSRVIDARRGMIASLLSRGERFKQYLSASARLARHRGGSKNLRVTRHQCPAISSGTVNSR